MGLFATSSAILIGASLSYAVYLFLKKKGENQEKQQVEEMKVDYMFTKGRQSIKQRLLHLIDNSQKTLDVAIYIVTDKEIISHLCYATNRGVKVRLITDKKQTYNNQLQNNYIQRLINNEIPVKINSHPGIMHLKLMISDNTTIASGSYNYTHTAETINDEVVVFINNRKFSTKWTKKFESMWNDSKNFINYPEQANQKYA